MSWLDYALLIPVILYVAYLLFFRKKKSSSCCGCCENCSACKGKE